MTTSFKIPLQQLDSAFIQRLKEQYTDAVVEISVATTQGNTPLTEDAFWDIIGLLNWNAIENEAILEAAIQHLSELSVAAIYQFQQILSQKLYQLDQRIYAEQVGYTENKYLIINKRHF